MTLLLKDNHSRRVDMTDNELNELIKINHDAPREHLEEDLFVNHKNEYVLFYEDDFYLWEGGWNKIVYQHGYYDLTGLRSLSDINTIIQLEQQKRELIDFLSGLQLDVSCDIERGELIAKVSGCNFDGWDLTNEDN